MIVLGRIVAPFGVRGWVRVHPFADDPAAWCELPQWWLGSDGDAPQSDAAWRAYKLLEVRDHGKGLIARLEGVADRNAAEAIDGMYIAAPREAMPATEEDEFYWADVIGLEAVNAKGESLGKVTSIIEAPANDVLVVEDSEQQRLLPFVSAVVLDVDAAAGVIRVAWERDW